MVEPPLAVCVVIALKTPQEEPLHPGPLSDHDSTVLGFELGTGVSVAAIVTLFPTGTLDGAESDRAKLLVMDSVAEICFKGSATLCAVTVALAGEGRILGAVNRPPESTAPHAIGHAPPDKLQRMAASG
jgi:hypothetical protein